MPCMLAQPFLLAYSICCVYGWVAALSKEPSNDQDNVVSLLAHECPQILLLKQEWASW
jgi:hypothetical protein